ncbi:iron-siderophore ABC transporter substrate-binding protein [Deinococcus deserti]|uniref:Putative Fe3+-citrate ABC transporter, periplasmic component n=1 Tax=Deinococcus deserti (strain DSM 17065 / CIP 109153 / LMG 22923 / VCD115) TaxID=546414 RepID=C1CWW7_DEIDV|nr:iron-siderophore ABC transporter substrate-binding protein [Deinococcus deserti]ACO46684.2 putative Fe3+-citrate ABC transporter, periplasmic component [Deinococcus deserti VCD115]
MTSCLALRWLALGVMLSSGSTYAATYPMTVEHAAGKARIERAPVRVVALGPHALDLLLSLGVQPVGYGEAAQLGITNYGSPISQIRYLGSRVTSKPLNVGDRYKPNLEVIAALKPDLIVGENYASEAYPALNRIAPTLLLNGIHTGDWQKSLPVLARVLNRENRPPSVLERHRKIITQARASLPAALRGKRVLVVWNAGGSQKDLYTVLGPKDWTGGLFESLGMRLLLPGNPDTSLDEGYQKLSVEGLSTLTPDAVFVIASGANTTTKARRDWESSPLAGRLAASRNRQVYFLDVQLFSRIRGPIANELAVRELLRQVEQR